MRAGKRAAVQSQQTFPPPLPKPSSMVQPLKGCSHTSLVVQPPAQAAQTQLSSAQGAILASGQRKSQNKILFLLFVASTCSAQNGTPENSNYITVFFFRNFLFVFVFKIVLRVDLHCNKEVIFLWQVLQLLRYSSESIALMKVETVRKTDKQTIFSAC